MIIFWEIGVIVKNFQRLSHLYFPLVFFKFDIVIDIITFLNIFKVKNKTFEEETRGYRDKDGNFPLCNTMSFLRSRCCLKFLASVTFDLVCCYQTLYFCLKNKGGVHLGFFCEDLNYTSLIQPTFTGSKWNLDNFSTLTAHLP